METRQASSSRYTYEVTVQSTRALDEATFYPGSTFSFYPQQAQEDTRWLLEQVFQYKGQPASTVDKEVVVFEGVEPIKSPLPQGVSLREIVESLTDFGYTPPSSWLHQELRPLLPKSHPYKVSESYASHLDKLIKSVPLTMLEVMKVLHSKAPFTLPVEFLLCMKRQAPRQYTVASTIDRDRGIFRLIISESFTEREVPDELKGIVKPQLTGLVSQMLRHIYCAKSSQIIRALPKPALFPTHAWQLGGVWVAAGSGVAPFIAFLEERRVSGPSSFGKTILFFGCRSSSDIDFIGKSTILEAVRDGFLEAAFFAFSRDEKNSRGAVRPGSLDLELFNDVSPSSAAKSDSRTPRKRVYVQDRILEEIEMVKKLLETSAEEVKIRQESEGALSGDAESSTATTRLVTHKVLICGSSDMGKAVVETLHSALGEDRLSGSILMEVW